MCKKFHFFLMHSHMELSDFHGHVCNHNYCIMKEWIEVIPLMLHVLLMPKSFLALNMDWLISCPYPLYISIVVNEELREDAKLKSVVLNGMLYTKRLTLVLYIYGLSRVFAIVANGLWKPLTKLSWTSFFSDHVINGPLIWLEISNLCCVTVATWCTEILPIKKANGPTIFNEKAALRAASSLGSREAIQLIYALLCKN